MSTDAGHCDPAMDFSGFDASTIKRAGSFDLDMSPDYAFPLFTAPGEVLWAPGWEPSILHGNGYDEGTVWVTSAGGQTTFWYVALYNTADRHAQYVRVTAGAHAGIVDVQVVPKGSGGSTVNVAYRLTGLSRTGNLDLENMFSESGYTAMMDEWRSAINESRDKIERHFGKPQRTRQQPLMTSPQIQEKPP